MGVRNSYELRKLRRSSNSRSSTLIISDQLHDNLHVKMQQSVQVPKEGERFPDLVITVNKGLADECIYIIELKYLKKTEARDKKSDSALQRLLNKATEELAAYKSALDFKGKNVKAYAMVFAGPDCVHCQQY